MPKITEELSQALAPMNPLALEWMSMASRDLEVREKKVGASKVQRGVVAEASLEALHEFLKDCSYF
jgi:hypothetical protein